MPRLVLASSLMGKTYTNTTYSNVYDFDQHTLAYKYNRDDYPHLTDEQFKGLPGRRINNNWFPTYMNDFCRLIDTTSHDVVLGWLQHHVVDELIVRGYRPELVLFDPAVDPSVMFERARGRGNNYTSETQVSNLFHKLYTQFNTPHYRTNCDLWVAHESIYLNEYLASTGTTLYLKDHTPDTTIKDVTPALEHLTSTT